ncbi:HAUS augmin-like complex subunit 6 [Cephus cinctus]|uniref:HAUS augmin-like complex subunit 6 n=1 Tax=Cephus cinctus TaxID=211228 RepID=A0AAJ7C1E1_CEPCN|nr:HAUS augmin-like complex subunit 6 [Cephus cinctus]
MSTTFDKSFASTGQRRDSLLTTNITEIKTSFYKNVSLLVKAVPASDEFKKYFHEHMFNKPNTMGFIYVTHFLLTVYDAERFKRTVEWPVICKKTEARYRIDIKNYLSELSNENPDIGFPLIMTSTLLHAGGTKFIILMWKLSQLVLYNYVKVQKDENVLLPPKPGVAEELTKRIFNNAINNIEIKLEKEGEALYHFIEECRLFAKEEADAIDEIRSNLFEMRKILEDRVTIAPTLSVVKKRLRNVEDVEIIELWKANILETQNYLKERNLRLSELESLSNHVNTIITNVYEPKILDVKKLEKLDTKAIRELNLPLEIQVSAGQLYVNEKLSLSTLLLLFSAILYKLRWYIRDKQWADVSYAQLQVQILSDDIRKMKNLFDLLFKRVKNLSSDIQEYSDHENLINIGTMSCADFPDMYKVLFNPSPKIEFNVNECESKRFLILELTPVEERHNGLFSRHKRRKDTTPRSSRICKNAIISRIKFDDTISSIINERQSPVLCRNESVLSASSVKSVKKYSRLFTNSSKTNNRKANYSFMSVPSASKANSTALMNIVEDGKTKTKSCLDIAAKNLFKLSKDVVSIASRISSRDLKDSLAVTPVKDNQVQDKSDVESLRTINALEEENIFEEIPCNGDMISPKTTKEKGGRTRRSISDLVEQYRTLVDRSSIQSIHFESSNVNNSTEKD